MTDGYRQHFFCYHFLGPDVLQQRIFIQYLAWVLGEVQQQLHRCMLELPGFLSPGEAVLRGAYLPFTQSEVLHNIYLEVIYLPLDK